jgi:F-type H+-transporting ATPase subunit gamma
VPSLRDIRRRIRSIQNTQKITKAMQVIAATRLRRAQQQAQAARPYAEKMVEVLQTLSERATEYKHPFLERREGSRAVMVLVTTDRGLAGALNMNTIRAATRYLSQNQLEQNYVTIGRKGYQFLARFRRNILAEVSGISDRPALGEILPVLSVALEEYMEGRADMILLAYAKWISTLRQQPTVQILVPLELPRRAEGEPRPTADYLYEPDPEGVLDVLLPRYIESQVYQALLENKASEYSARMIAMQNATEAAGDLITSLTLTANKVRQATITTELMEIVGGAEALRSSS